MLESINPKCQRMRSKLRCFPQWGPTVNVHRMSKHTLSFLSLNDSGVWESRRVARRRPALHKKEHVHVRTSSHTAHGRCRMSGCSQKTAPCGLTFTFLQRCNVFLCACVVLSCTSRHKPVGTLFIFCEPPVCF